MNDAEQTNAMVRASSQSIAGNGNQSEPLSVQDVMQRITFIKQVMSAAMDEGIDYGKIPGCGDKPTLLQPGAQKLSLTFNLNTEVREEKVTTIRGDHREYSFIVRVQNAQGGKFADGVGTCSTLESKYRYRQSDRKCPTCGQPAIIKGKEQFGGGYICFTKKGGCGAKFNDDDTAITSQVIGRVEFENPADYWNTVRKIAFKRAYIHATINVTNTSQLWSSDLEDMADNREHSFDAPIPSAEQPPPATTPKQTTGYAAGWRNTVLGWGKNKGKRLGDLDAEALNWYATKWQPKEYPEGSGKFSKADIALRKALDEAMAERQAGIDGIHMSIFPTSEPPEGVDDLVHD